jgi:hypothetical protein
MTVFHCPAAPRRKLRLQRESPFAQLREGALEGWSTRPGSNRRPPRWQRGPRRRKHWDFKQLRLHADAHEYRFEGDLPFVAPSWPWRPPRDGRASARSDRRNFRHIRAWTRRDSRACAGSAGCFGRLRSAARRARPLRPRNRSGGGLHGDRWGRRPGPPPAPRVERRFRRRHGEVLNAEGS